MKQMIFFFTLVFSFSLFAADKAKTISLNISGMTCQSCANTVEKALKKVDGVKEAKVDLKNKKAIVLLASTKTTQENLIKAVNDAGFTAKEGTSSPKSQMKKGSKMDDKDCNDGSCGDESSSNIKQTKTKKTETKKS